MPEGRLDKAALQRHHAKWCALLPPKPVTPEHTLAQIHHEAGIQKALEIIGQQICKI